MGVFGFQGYSWLGEVSNYYNRLLSWCNGEVYVNLKVL